MNILAFHYGTDCHDTSAAMVCDGSLVAAAEEERSRLQELMITERYDARFSREFFRATGLLIAMRDGGGLGLTSQLEKTVGKSKDLEQLNKKVPDSAADPSESASR